jgi:hypothetical protein
LDGLLEKINLHLDPSQALPPSDLKVEHDLDNSETFDDWLNNLESDPIKLFNEIKVEPKGAKAAETETATDKTEAKADETEWEDIPLDRSPLNYIVLPSLINLDDIVSQSGNKGPRSDITFGNIDQLLKEEGLQSLLD